MLSKLEVDDRIERWERDLSVTVPRDALPLPDREGENGPRWTERTITLWLQSVARLQGSQVGVNVGRATYR